MTDKILKLYSTDEYGNIHGSKADKGFFGEDVYNTREFSPEYPPVESGKVAVLEDNQWVLKDDNRGDYYNTESGQPVEIRKPLDPIDGLTKIKPDCDYPKWDGSKWIIDTEKKTAFEEMTKKSELAGIDIQSIRPLRAVLTAIQEGKTPPAGDVTKLKELETAAKDKRAQ